jgi:hypothetical protein
MFPGGEGYCRVVVHFKWFKVLGFLFSGMKWCINTVLPIIP